MHSQLLTGNTLASGGVPSPAAFSTPSAESEAGTSSYPTSVDDDEDPFAGDDDAPNHNDIAIIGMGCRVPGGNNTPEMLWDYLMNKGDASGDMPSFRWEPYHRRNPKNAETLSKTTSKGYFLDNLLDFDASFFAVSPREAEQMDPQQRMVLEVTWEALENAGIPPQELSGSDTSVYMGVNSDDYGKLILEDLQNVGAHMGVGTAYCGIPSRISYVLNLMGPSIAVDAACASSLVAIHQARQALLAGETELAIAGGVNALLGPGLTRVLDEAGAISADGKCRSFDDSANGYGRGEGAGVVVLKRLDKAVTDGDHVLGLLKGSAVCADGKTLGIMAPNPVAQQIVARRALKEAKISADTISYVEAHATSTPLGDVTETEALAQIYGHGARPAGSPPCLVGSLKSNIGHLEAGAGVMGLIKAVMVLRHGVVPPQVNLVTRNTRINWDTNLLKACKEPTELSPSIMMTSRQARAAIASYGYSGTVSHAIIEGASLETEKTTWSESEQPKSPVLLFLSSPQASRLPSAAQSLARWLETDDSRQQPLENIANTLASRRGHHGFRASITAETKAEAITLLDKFATDQEDSMIVSGRIAPAATKGPVWVFSGHGSQWPEMGQELYNTEPTFADVVHQVEPVALDILGFSVKDALLSGKFENSDEIQVLIFVMHVGLAAVLESRCGSPSAIVGHSLGETAASVVAGALTLYEGTLIVCLRARLFRQVMGSGAMILVTLGVDEALTKLKDHPELDVAIDSSPGSCVISGPKEAILKLSDELKEDSYIRVFNVRSDIPFHSKELQKLVDALRQGLGNKIHPRPPRIPLYSTSSPDPRTQQLRDVQYWTNNMVQPVLLRSTVNAMAEDGYRTFVEVSSHPIVANSINETLSEGGIDDFITVPTMVRKQPAMKSLLTSIGRLHCFGCSVLYTKQSRQPWAEGVPGTAWAHQKFWREVAHVPFGESTTRHDPSSNNLLGSRIALWGSDKVLFQTRLDDENKPFPGKHPLHGSEIVPAAVLINTFLNATSGRCLENMSLKVPVSVSPPRDVQIMLDAQQIAITSKLVPSEATDSDDESWLINTTSRVGAEGVVPSQSSINLTDLQKRLPRALPNTFSIDYLAKVGVPDMGFPWKVVSHIENDEGFLAKVETNPENIDGMNNLHTSILDSATSIASTLFYRAPQLRMPTSVTRVIYTGLPERLETGYVYCKKNPSTEAADVLVCSEEGNVVFEFQSMAFSSLEGDSVSRKSTNGLYHRIAWTPATLAEEPHHFSQVVFFSSEENPAVDIYTKQLEAKGLKTALVNRASSLNNIDSNAVVVHVPDPAISKESAFQAGANACESLISAVKAISSSSASNIKLFSLIKRDGGVADLGFAPLFGLARIIKSEQPDIWGGLIEGEDDSFPLAAIKYVQAEDVVKMDDGIPRTARLRPFVQDAAARRAAVHTFHPGSTYLITGGLGALGLEVAAWMAERGARRILLVSRRHLPRRSTWKDHESNAAVQKIAVLEKFGVTVHSLSVDMSASNSDVLLTEAVSALDIPPVAGVIHAAGVLEDQLIDEVTTDAFNRVLAPKIHGALTLDKVFPPGSLDFFTLFSSCGQLLGFPGQASYASGNSFLDVLAAQRRQLGDNAVSILWTSWSGLGMSTSTEYINAELSARGISDVTREEAFKAWDQIATLDTDHAVVLRALPLDADEPLPHPILRDIAPRRERASPPDNTSGPDKESSRPASGPELEQYLETAITSCVAGTLGISAMDVDRATALSEMGMDSVMAVTFRSKVQQSLKVKMPVTLVWKCPTVKHLVMHFTDEFQKKA